MKRFLDSLYGRLALVLIIALAAAFGTMYGVFQSHSNDNRFRNLSHTMAVQIQLVEELLRTHADFETNPIKGVVIAASPGEGAASTPEQEELIHGLKNSLDEEMGRNSEIRISTAKVGGFWVRLSDVPQGERWLYFSKLRQRSHAEPWRWGLWVGYFVVLVGGMALLWGVNKPLRRLEGAIDKVGRVDSPVVATSGPREIRNLADQFNQMVLRLKQYDQDRAEMLAGVAHDLRAPITRLRLQLEMEESVRRNAMIANLDGIDAIVNQFLSFAQGVVAEPAETRCLPTLLEEIAEPYRQNGVIVSTEGLPIVELPVMPTLLRRALTNLLENAIAYGEPPIVMACEKRPGEAVIRVSDHGPGIPSEKRHLALQAFTRLDSARSGKGHCGLGLAIAAKIAALHQGSLSLEQNTPRGLVVEIHLPLAPIAKA